MYKKSQKLVEQKIPKLLFQQSLPAAVGMFVMTLYNVVDTIFIGKGVGTLGLAGVAISFPLVMAIGAVAQMLGVGFSSIISRSIGARNCQRAERAFGNYLTVSFLFGLAMTITGLLLFIPLLKFLGASSSVFPYAKDYTSIIILGSIFFVFLAGGNNIIRSTGDAKKAMQAMIISSLVNIILDYIFIFEFGMGIKGAAWATVISWIIGVAYVLGTLLGKNKNIKLQINNLKLDVEIVKEGLLIGLSSFARQISSSVMMLFLNKSLSIYSTDLIIAAFGIIMRILMLVLMPIVGLVQGLMPIIGANHGARNFERTYNATMLAIKVATTISMISYMIILLFPDFLVSIFTSDVALIESSKDILRIIVIGIPLVGFQMVAGGFYQALGRAKQALFISLLRQIFLFVPLMLIFPFFWGLEGIFYAFPVADILSAVITFYIFRKSFSQLKRV
ncbi:MATE family efflux transporter [Patescibacteria group bacterium]|nr:MATE family efflux transporter [Patescibacteria group bacterium]